MQQLTSVFEFCPGSLLLVLTQGPMVVVVGIQTAKLVQLAGGNWAWQHYS